MNGKAGPIKIIAAISFVALLAVGLAYWGLDRKRSDVPYDELIAAFRELEALEKEAFERLVFTLSPRKVDPSLSFKFVVVDQLGREWLFKSTSNGEASDGEIAVHRIFKLFGLKTPEIHVKTLTVNGHPLTGTMQLMILPNLGALNDNHIRRMPLSGRIYIAKAHILSWLVANHHIHPKQHLVTTLDGRTPNGVMRIDNSIEWFLIGYDSLSVRYQSPLLWNHPRVGYANYWSLFLNETFHLPLINILNWAKMVSGFPDDVYASFFEEGVKNGMKTFANNAVMPGTKFYQLHIPEIIPLVNEENLIPTLVNRKNNLMKDLARFLDELRAVRSDVPLIDRAREPARAARRVIDWLRGEANRVKEVLAALDKLPTSEQEPFELDFSFKAYQALRPLVVTHVTDEKERWQLIRRTITKLTLLERHSPSAIEKRSAAIARANLQKILQKYIENKDKLDPIWLRWEMVHLNELIQEDGLSIERRTQKREERIRRLKEKIRGGKESESP